MLGTYSSMSPSGCVLHIRGFFYRLMDSNVTFCSDVSHIISNFLLHLASVRFYVMIRDLLIVYTLFGKFVSCIQLCTIWHVYRHLWWWLRTGRYFASVQRAQCFCSARLIPFVASLSSSSLIHILSVCSLLFTVTSFLDGWDVTVWWLRRKQFYVGYNEQKVEQRNGWKT